MAGMIGAPPAFDIVSFIKRRQQQKLVLSRDGKMLPGS
jgi:hypothetical protein